MVPVDDIRQTLSVLKSFPSEALVTRADAEGDAPLESGRTLQQTLDLGEELIETVGTLLNKGRIESLPVPMAKQIRASLTGIAEQAQRVAEGTHEPQELENHIETLHARLWTPGLLHDLEELPGQEAKNRKLEGLKNKGRRIVRELEDGKLLVSKLREALTALTSKVEEASTKTEEIEAKRAAVEQAAGQASAYTNSTQEVLTRAKKIEQEITEARTSAKASDDEVGALKEKVKRFFGDIEKNDARLESLFSDTEEALKRNRTDAQSLLDRLKELEAEIEQQLQKATGASLFHAFHERRRNISTAKWIWAALSVSSLGFSVWWGIFLAGAAQTLNAMFWVKLAATLPLLAVVVFCLTQYGRERRAEEQYAFKAALSLSLVPYKELIEGVEGGDWSPEYAKFLVTTIGQIYSPPSVDVDHGRDAEEYVSLRGIRAITQMMEKLVNR